MSKRKRTYRRGAKAILLVAGVAVCVSLPGCAQSCGDYGTREGAWGLVFRCSTTNRVEHQNRASTGRASRLGLQSPKR